VKKQLYLILGIFLLVLPLSANNGVTVAISGDSIAQFMGGFQAELFPNLPASEVSIFGQYGATCLNLLQRSPTTGQPLLLFMVPASAQIVVLYETSNGISTGMTIQQQVVCVQQTIAYLWYRNNNIKIILANQLPWRQGSYVNGQYEILGCTGYFDAHLTIEAWNATYGTTNWNAGYPPGTVTLIDVWSPNVNAPGTMGYGFGAAADIIGPCGIHPDQPNRWSPVWRHFTIPMVDAVNNILGGE
jgi:hypothetical protein